MEQRIQFGPFYATAQEFAINMLGCIAMSQQNVVIFDVHEGCLLHEIALPQRSIQDGKQTRKEPRRANFIFWSSEYPFEKHQPDLLVDAGDLRFRIEFSRFDCAVVQLSEQDFADAVERNRALTSGFSERIRSLAYQFPISAELHRSICGERAWICTEDAHVLLEELGRPLFSLDLKQFCQNQCQGIFKAVDAIWEEKKLAVLLSTGEFLLFEQRNGDVNEWALQDVRRVVQTSMVPARHKLFPFRLIVVHGRLMAVVLKMPSEGVSCQETLLFAIPGKDMQEWSAFRPDINDTASGVVQQDTEKICWYCGRQSNSKAQSSVFCPCGAWFV